METLSEVERLLTLHEVAHMLGVSYWTVYNWIREGKLKGVKVASGRWRVPKSALEKFYKENFRRGKR